MPIIIATQETEIRRIKIQASPRQIVHKTLSQKNRTQKRTGGVAQTVTASAQQALDPSATKKKKIKKFLTLSQIY
jgi:hypothetical protein